MLVRCLGKTTFRCGKEYEFNEDNFVKNSKGSLIKLCRSCNNEYLKDYAEKNKEKYIKIKRDRHLKNTYGISLTEYDSLLESQNKVCKICAKEESIGRGSKKERNLSVDHCHKSSIIRGLVCNDCNTRIGQVEFFIDNPDCLRKILSHIGANTDVLSRG
jgi:Recombination endonuclease VII